MKKIVYFDMDNVLVDLGKKINQSYSHLDDPTDEVEDMFLDRWHDLHPILEPN